MSKIADREQDLVDLIFQFVLAVSSPEHAAKFAEKSVEDRVAWVAKQLRSCGFDTVPIGASWGILRKHLRDAQSEIDTQPSIDMDGRNE